MSPQEREIKLAIADRRSYDRLCSELEGFEKEIEQINYYLDGPGLRLGRHNTMLRVRTRADRDGGVLTLKRGTTIRDGYFDSSEEEVSLSPREVGALLERPARIERLGPEAAALFEIAAGKRPAPPLEVVGELRNIRRNYRLPEGVFVELDRLCFGEGEEEYEVEVETDDPDGVREILGRIFARIEVSATPRSETKFQRLMARIRDT